MTLALACAAPPATGVALSALADPASAQEAPVSSHRPAAASDVATRVLLVADVHSVHSRFHRFVDVVNEDRPDLVVELGDAMHDGTASEFLRARRDRDRLAVPLLFAPGNHDVVMRGPYHGERPSFPGFQVNRTNGLRFIVLDNGDGTLPDSLFVLLEEELAGTPGEPTLVFLHMPPWLESPPRAAAVRHLMPFRLSDPTMSRAREVERFTTVMERHGVLAVVAGHAHAPHHFVRGGVEYYVVGALGGLTPWFGIDNEYVELTIRDRELEFRRVPVGSTPRNPVTFVARAFRFYARLNDFNHGEQGWNYMPSVTVQLRGGTRWDTGDDPEPPALLAVASFERLFGQGGWRGLTADAELAAGPSELAPGLSAGIRLRPVGNFNRSLYLAASALGTGGIMRGAPGAAIGGRLSAGIEWYGFTAELGRHHVAGRASTLILIGRRY